MSNGVHLRLADLEPHDAYKLLSGVVIPRPIAWVTSIDAAGVVNAAPFSFFNCFSEAPPLVVLGLQHRPDGSGAKDTSRNVRETGEFVVNLTNEATAEAMNVTAVNAPPGVSELGRAGLDTMASTAVRPPRIAQAPVALECRRTVVLNFAPSRELLVGEVLVFHAAAGIVDPADLRVDLDAYRPIGRLFANLYCRTRDTFVLERPSWKVGEGGPHDRGTTRR